MFHSILIIFYGMFAVTQLIKAEVTYSYTLPRDELLPVIRKLDKFADCNENATITNDYEFIFTINQPTAPCDPDTILQQESFTDFIENAITKPIYVLTTNQGKTNYPTCVDSINKETTDIKTTTLKSINPKSTDPKRTDPESTDPESTDPESTDPESTDPESTDPESTDRKGNDPKGTDPKSTDPKSTDPKNTNTEKKPPLKGLINYPPNPVDSTSKVPPEMITTLNPLQEKLMREKKERNNYLATIITAVLVGLMVAAVVGCAITQYVKTVRQSGTYVVGNP